MSGAINRKHGILKTTHIFKRRPKHFMTNPVCFERAPALSSPLVHKQGHILCRKLHALVMAVLPTLRRHRFKLF